MGKKDKKDKKEKKEKDKKEDKDKKSKKEKKDKKDKKEKKDKDKDFKSRADEETKVSDRQSVDKKTDNKEVYEKKSPKKEQKKDPPLSSKENKEEKSSKPAAKLKENFESDFIIPKIKPAPRAQREKITTKEGFIDKMKSICKEYTSKGYFSHEHQSEIAESITSRISNGLITIPSHNEQEFSRVMKKIKEEWISPLRQNLHQPLHLDKTKFMKESPEQCYTETFDLKDTRNMIAYTRSLSQQSTDGSSKVSSKVEAAKVFQDIIKEK